MEDSDRNNKASTERETSTSHEGDTQRRVFSSLFFGWSPRSESDDSSRSPLDEETVKRVRKRVDEALRKRAKEQAHSVTLDISKFLPHDPQELKEQHFYQATYRLLQYQRDSYLVGKHYADWRQQERKDARATLHSDLPHDPEALGHAQLAKLAKDFIPSTTVRNAALPLVVDLPVKVILQPATTGLVNLILGQQERLDHIVKEQLTGILMNPNVRLAIKNSTNRFISTRYK